MYPGLAVHSLGVSFAQYWHMVLSSTQGITVTGAGAGAGAGASAWHLMLQVPPAQVYPQKSPAPAYKGQRQSLTASSPHDAPSSIAVLVAHVAKQLASTPQVLHDLGQKWPIHLGFDSHSPKDAQ